MIPYPIDVDKLNKLLYSISIHPCHTYSVINMSNNLIMEGKVCINHCMYFHNILNRIGCILIYLRRTNILDINQLGNPQLHNQDLKMKLNKLYLSLKFLSPPLYWLNYQHHRIYNQYDCNRIPHINFCLVLTHLVRVYHHINNKFQNSYNWSCTRHNN